MRYLVHARLRPERAQALLQAIESGRLGWVSVAFGEYIRNMLAARCFEDGSVRWVEVCYCPTPLEEEIPYWQEYFQLTRIVDAHAPDRCRDRSGAEPWACSSCDCTRRLEDHLAARGQGFYEVLTDLAARPDRAG